MPLINIERIVSFSSEDPNHTANNILLKDTSKKWKCKVVGEKNASVVLQLDQPYVISSIDIGNEYSAYIEVLVSRSTLQEHFKGLLVMSSFMTPLEARQGQNVNKVRMFKQEDFVEPERNEKWDRVMIVCSQPFNRHVQYGLSFINLYTSDKKLENPRQPLIGKFVIRPESPDNITSGALFARRKELQENSSEQILKGAAAIREATSLAMVASPIIKHKLKNNLLTTPVPNINDDNKNSLPKPRNRAELLYNTDDEDDNGHHSKVSENELGQKFDGHEEINYSLKNKEREKPGIAKKTSDIVKNVTKESNNQKKTNVGTDSKKRKHLEDPKHSLKTPKKKCLQKPFVLLLENVVLVISGIQNPERSSLRSMALSMGAKYKKDWDTDCTHLICAFKNTPKFHQVKGKGKIVKKEWLNDCYNERKKLPWRKYALDENDKGIESEEEICEQQDKEYFGNTTVQSDTEDEMREEGSDTETKIEQIKQKQTPTKDVFQADTDDESLNNNCHENLDIRHNLKTLFYGKAFYVDTEFDVKMRKKIEQYVAGYGGMLSEDFKTGIDFFIKHESNNQRLQDVCISAIYVSPDWIWDCHNCQKLVSMEDYII